jgi:hypothetical protein
MEECEMVEAAPRDQSQDRERDRIAFAAFVNLADLWNLTADQQVTLLGSPARSTFFKWK